MRWPIEPGPWILYTLIWTRCLSVMYGVTRKVAVKVLPDSWAADPKRMAQFQVEAEVLAASNYPNIAATAWGSSVESRGIVSVTAIAPLGATVYS